MPHNMSDYEATYRSFELKAPKKFNFARDVFDRWGGDKLAMLWVNDDGREVRKTFGDLSRESQKVANLLSDAGVCRGDVVIAILPRLVEWWLINLASLRMGAVLSPGTPQLTAKDIRYRIESAEARCVITDQAGAVKTDESASRVSTLIKILVGGAGRSGWLGFESAFRSASENFPTADTNGDEKAILYFTSGTTGTPKMTVHTHTSFPLAHRITGEFWLDLNADDLHWNLSDTGWAKAAYSSLYGPWMMGAAIFVHHTPKFDAKQTLELLSQHPITTFCAGPTLFRLFVMEDLESLRFPNLRHAVAAREPLNPEVIEAWKKATGIEIQDGYGQTETVLLVGNYPCLETRPGSMGKPTPGFDVRVIDEHNQIAPVDKEGDIAVRVRPDRPVGLFKEYWKDPVRTAGVYRGDWYITGDRAYRDADGYLWFVGRADDVILSAGYRIGPFEVESALLEHGAVVESAVISSPDDVRGEVVKALVVLAPGCEASDRLKSELQNHVKETTAPYKYPRKIEFVDSLPKTVSGKIRRNILRKSEWGE